MSNPVSLVGYHLTFDAEMTSSADLSLFSNTFPNGDVTISGNVEQETYVPSSSNPNTYTFSNGALNINATPNASGGYTSGLLTTYNTFQQNQGYFEIRAKFAAGTGFWPAFWLLSPDYTKEIDIAEQPNSQGPSTYYQSVKAGAYGSADNYGKYLPTDVDLSAGYHTYGFMWTQYSIQFTLDGNYIGSAAPTPAGLATTKMYILANLAVGKDGNPFTGIGSPAVGGSPASGATSTFSIDYIRAYSADASVPASSGNEQVSTPDTGVTTPVATTTASITQPAISTTTVSVPVYRFFDSRTGTQFLTSSSSERDTVIATRPDLINEGVGLNAVVPAAGDTNAVSIYRFFDTVYGTHFYTSSSSERDSVLVNRSDLTYEGVGFSDYATQQTGTTAVYRFFETSNGTHFYTANASERATILSTRPDLVAEGVAFWAPSST